jgi:hypothetical protein
MTALTPSDLPTNGDDLEDGAESLLGSAADIDATIEAALIIGQLDPLEVKDGAPRWSPAQQELIVKANQLLSEWRDS